MNNKQLQMCKCVLEIHSHLLTKKRIFVRIIDQKYLFIFFKYNIFLNIKKYI